MIIQFSPLGKRYLWNKVTKLFKLQLVNWFKTLALCPPPQDGIEQCSMLNTKFKIWGFPGGTVVKNLPANAGDTGSSPGLGRSHMPRSS